MTSTSWRKSSYSDAGGSSCVEVALDAHAAAVRDSKNTAGPILTFGGGAWRALLAAQGESANQV
ncbi:uncharacterized protein DUF397 [Herbihabitans rhizosphaerae]|uniref:Uncharacterized protein DUF397 n=1 Tax=Herbihabitans rhizosphaerae TaxID=1872711 RepID=A0A4Q7KJD5_9PSEU|nr:DUF397 domain-containing protein [Herbihabitans rhizosphaerae]RZS34724.1 uncharacterized protein DUF397 [Herbihabitans rhizosphaerae]